MVEWINVPFEGEGAGFGGLTWGQQQIWRAMVEVESSMSIGGVVPVTDGRVLADFVEELRFLMSRFAALRSRLVFDRPEHATSRDTCSLVRQQVFAAGEAVLEVHDVDPAGDPAVVAAGIFSDWQARKFDYTGEWPIRQAVVRQAATITHVVVVVCHVAVDGGALGVMIRELRDQDSVTGTPHRPYTAMQPLELVAAQASARRTTEAAMRYWERCLRAIDSRRFAVGPIDRGEPRWRRVVWRSPAFMLAAQRIAAGVDVDSGAVVLAAFAVAFSRIAGNAGPFAAQVVVSNRFRPGLADVVSPLAENGLVVIDVADSAAEDVVRRARQALTQASKHAYYEPDVRLELIDRIGRERGAPIDLAVLYNDRRVGAGKAPDPAGPLPTGQEVRGALPLTETVSESSIVVFNEKLMVHVDDVPGTIQVTVDVDTHYLAIEDLYRLLAGMEAFTVLASVDGTPYG